jgi:hypothetical protein
MRSAVVVASVVLVGIGASLSAQSRPAAAPLRQTAYLKASNTEANDHFGNGGTLLGDSVTISSDGNTIAVSANNESTG